jgi:O-antigen ligase/cytochrome c-type biogenesis protein CcmH/NrfG
MTPLVSSTAKAPARLFVCGEWLLVAGLMATLAWTTLCLGGYRPETMVGVSWGVFGLSALGGGLWVLGRGAEPVTFNWTVLLPVPFLLYAWASGQWIAPAKWLAWREWLLWLQMWLVFALMLHFGRGRRHTWVIIGTFVTLGLTGVVMAAYQRYGNSTWLMMGRTQAEQFFGRSAGMFGIPNSLAALLELMIPACLALLFSRATSAIVKIACGWLAALFIFAMVLTGSRGGWIALGLGLMLWPLLGGREWRRRVAGAAIILALAAGGVAILYRFSAHAHARILPFLEGKFELSRPIIWKAGLQIWRDHPWLGSGAASYNVVFDQYRPRGFLNEPDWAHNDYVNTLSDYGVAGFALWFAAGGGLLWLGWQAVQRARQTNAPIRDVPDHWQWRLGVFLGLLAFAFHLGVDFHTKLPALAFASAMVFALLLRDEPALSRSISTIGRRGIGFVLAAGAILLACLLASPLYRAETLRYASRQAINRQAATRQGNKREIMAAAKANFEQAVRVDPGNGHAWADLSYALAQTSNIEGGDVIAFGRQAEAAATRALELCPINAEFWVRKGVALDMQARQNEGEKCFKRAVELAPNTPAWWYYYAYHLSARRGRAPEAMRAVETCLALDPSNSAAVGLRQQLAVTR